MASSLHLDQPLPDAGFGGIVRCPDGPAGLLQAAEATPALLPGMLVESGGLLLVPDMQAMANAPELLVRLSRLFGTEVEDYRETLTPRHMVHPTVPEIFVVSNTPPASRPPPRRPEPPLTAEGTLPTQYPHRRGWHTDQSYRRPPPDISLFLAVEPVPQGQGQTLFANGAAAYAALPPPLRSRLDGLDGLHVGMGAGRDRASILAGNTPRALAPHEQPQRQPVARPHPVTGQRALYLCEWGQMDWLDGPFPDLQPGPHGDGAALLDELMTHLTRRAFVYVHEWTRGDLIVWDNRCLVHAATWFDAERERRVMWRTTVSGNPGALYAGNAKSWTRQAVSAA